MPFGPVLSVLLASSYDDAVKLINAHEFGNDTAIFIGTATPRAPSPIRSRRAWSASTCRSRLPVASHSFGGKKRSIFRDHAIYRLEGIYRPEGALL
jgi:malonate-semialdehyde dehydrogenase (acetylating)/methylmalonate-semialdehyde dehydrogenase